MVCPWWLGYFLIGPWRKWRQDPSQILASHVRPGMVVLEPGPGMGFFTLTLLSLVGETGKVVAVDIQERMLKRLRQRAERRHLSARLETRLARGTSLGIDELNATVDFVLAFAMVHEVPDQPAFFSEVSRSLRPGATLLLAEPAGHVSREAFEKEIETASQVGLVLESRPTIARSHAALLRQGPL